MQAPPPLRELQLRMRALIHAPATRGDGDGAALLAGVPIRGDERLDARERIAIYAGMYFARIRDAIAEDYRALERALGGAAFEALIAAYIDAHRPSHPSLRQAASHLAAFVERRPDLAPEPWHAPLARLEAAMVEAFDARDEEPLRAQALEALEPEAWSDLTLRPVASLVLREEACAVDRLREGLLADDGDAPADARIAAALDLPGVTLRVWRQELTVYYRRIGARERDALALLAGGASFGELCAWLEEQLRGEAPGESGRGADGDAIAARAATEAATLLQRWLEDELLIRL